MCQNLSSARRLVCDFFFQAEDGIRDLVRSRGLGDVYKRQRNNQYNQRVKSCRLLKNITRKFSIFFHLFLNSHGCLLYTSDAADERSSVDLGGRRIIKKKKHLVKTCISLIYDNNTDSCAL